MPQDDWFCNEAVPLWGRSGRGDLRVMKQLGANMVRLYGNNPENDHTNFLDEALEQGISVSAGMSDYPYYQMWGNCISTDMNCFTQIKPLYADNLRKGFLRPDGTYHPALKYMNILNEPDLKVPAGADTGGPEGPVKMARALLSAMDAMLDAEMEAGVTGPLINFTATFSFAICSACSETLGVPALGQMAQLDDAMFHPEKYGYSPKNDVTAAYKTRFTHSFNTASPASDVQNWFLPAYTTRFPTTPVYIGEYHCIGANQVEDVGRVLSTAQQNPLFLGVSFFQYQVAYWKTGSERDFGMFALSSSSLGTFDYFGTTFNLYCLEPQPDANSGMEMPSAVSNAYGGSGVDYSSLCLRSPEGVALNVSGYSEILAQSNVPKMAGFIERLVHHMGGVVNPGVDDALQTFAQGFVDGRSGGFEDLVSALGSQSTWIDYDSHAKCVASRSVQPSTIEQATDWACSQVTSFSCDDIPSQCAGNIYRVADYVFSRYYKEVGATNPLTDCSFHGAAVFASSVLYSKWTGTSHCAEGGVATATTRASTTAWAPGTEPGTTAAPATMPITTTVAPGTEPATPIATTTEAAGNTGGVASHGGCVASREAQPAMIQQAMDWACSHVTSFSCSEIPSECAGSTYRTADYVFSRYFREAGGVNPNVNCAFGGAAVFASSELYAQWTDASQCPEQDVAAPIAQDSTTTLGSSTEMATTAAASTDTTTSAPSSHEDATTPVAQDSTTAMGLSTELTTRTVATSVTTTSTLASHEDATTPIAQDSTSTLGSSTEMATAAATTTVTTSSTLDSNEDVTGPVAQDSTSTLGSSSEIGQTIVTAIVTTTSMVASNEDVAIPSVQDSTTTFGSSMDVATAAETTTVPSANASTPSIEPAATAATATDGTTLAPSMGTTPASVGPGGAAADPAALSNTDESSGFYPDFIQDDVVSSAWRSLALSWLLWLAVLLQILDSGCTAWVLK